VNAGFVTGDAWSSLATPSSGSPGSSRPRTCAARGNRPPSRAGSPREGPPRLPEPPREDHLPGPCAETWQARRRAGRPGGEEPPPAYPATPAKNRQRPRL